MKNSYKILCVSVIFTFSCNLSIVGDVNFESTINQMPVVELRKANEGLNEKLSEIRKIKQLKDTKQFHITGLFQCKDHTQSVLQFMRNKPNEWVFYTAKSKSKKRLKTLRDQVIGNRYSFLETFERKLLLFKSYNCTTQTIEDVNLPNIYSAKLGFRNAFKKNNLSNSSEISNSIDNKSLKKLLKDINLGERGGAFIKFDSYTNRTYEIIKVIFGKLNTFVKLKDIQNKDIIYLKSCGQDDLKIFCNDF